MTIFLSDHPLIMHKLSILRDLETPSIQFRQVVHEISLLLSYQVTIDLELSQPFKKPNGNCVSSVCKLKDRIGIIPILRSGLSMVPSFELMMPTCRILHLGLFREQVTLQPIEYYNKLPSIPNVDTCLILDPLIATAGTAISAVNIIKEWGIPGQKIKFISIVGTKEGVHALNTAHPDIQIYLVTQGDTLDDKGRAVPGIGDVGDRLFYL